MKCLTRGVRPTLSHFIMDVYLPQLRSMTYGSALYLAYGQIAVGIELLGACGDTHDFAQQGHSKCRCERGISDYMAQIDQRYATYNNSASPYYLYKHLRCGCPTCLSQKAKLRSSNRGSEEEEAEND